MKKGVPREGRLFCTFFTIPFRHLSGHVTGHV